MQHTSPTRKPSADETTSTVGLGRFEACTALGWLGLVVGAVPFLLLWVLVAYEWPPLSVLDGEVAASLNAEVSDSPVAVRILSALTDLAGTGTALLIFSLTTLFLLIRRERRLAAFVATTGLGLAVLGPAAKAVVDRARPVVEAPVVQTPSNASFPSGHAMTAVVMFGVLLVLVLPAVRRSARPWLIAGTAVLVAVISFTRLALGVHFVSDVLAGWALGAGWLSVTVAAFRSWQRDRGVDPDEPLDPLRLAPTQVPRLASAREPVLPSGRSPVLRLAAWAGALLVAITTAGLLVTGAPTDTWLHRVDSNVVAWFVEVRSERLTTVMDAVSALSGTRAVIAIGLSLCVCWRWPTRRPGARSSS